MDTDLALVLGLLLVCLAIPSMVSAYSDGRPPVVPGTVLAAGIGLAAYAWVARPGGYAASELPQVIMGALARFLP